MKTQTDSERLLGEVLLDDDVLSAHTLALVLGEVRHRQGRRQRRKRAAGYLALLLSFSATLWVVLPSVRHANSPGTASVSASAGIEMVRSWPLASDALIDSRSFPSPVTIETRANLDVVSSRSTAIVPRIDDGELFTFLQGHPVALVRRPDGSSAALVLVPDEEQILGLP